MRDSDEMKWRIADMLDDVLKINEEYLAPRGQPAVLNHQALEHCLVVEPTTTGENGKGGLKFQDASRRTPGSKPNSVSSEGWSRPQLLHMADASKIGSG